MYGYKITFEGLPGPVWCREATVTNYSRENPHSDDMLEISIITAGHLITTINNAKYVFDNTHALACIVEDENVSVCSNPEAQISVATIAVRFQKLNVVSKELTTDDCIDNTSLLIPAFTESMSEDEMNEIDSLMHKYIRHNERNTEHNKIMCYSIFYDILARIDSHVRKHLNRDTKDIYNHYVKKVNWIIQGRYNTKLTESVIAKELGISSGYLSAMYKKTTGRTVSQYLLVFRMRKAEELLESDNMPTSKIAAAVGFDDENYFRKKFKQYFGMNIKEYKNIKREKEQENE